MAEPMKSSLRRALQMQEDAQSFYAQASVRDEYTASSAAIGFAAAFAAPPRVAANSARQRARDFERSDIFGVAPEPIAGRNHWSVGPTVEERPCSARRAKPE